MKQSSSTSDFLVSAPSYPRDSRFVRCPLSACKLPVLSVLTVSSPPVGEDSLQAFPKLCLKRATVVGGLERLVRALHLADLLELMRYIPHGWVA